MGATSVSLGAGLALPVGAGLPVRPLAEVALPLSPRSMVAASGAAAVPVPGLLVDPGLLRDAVVVLVGLAHDDTAQAARWVAALGGRAILVADLPAACRALDARRGATAAVILNADGAGGDAMALGRLRSLHPRAAILHASAALRLNDFAADRPLDRDAALRLPLRRAAFCLGLAQALANARHRQGIARA